MNIAYPVTFFYISLATTSLQDAYEGDNVWGKAVTLHMLEGTKASWTWLCLAYPTMSIFQDTIFWSFTPFLWHTLWSQHEREIKEDGSYYKKNKFEQLRTNNMKCSKLGMIL